MSNLLKCLYAVDYTDEWDEDFSGYAFYESANIKVHMEYHEDIGWIGWYYSDKPCIPRYEDQHPLSPCSSCEFNKNDDYDGCTESDCTINTSNIGSMLIESVYDTQKTPYDNYMSIDLPYKRCVAYGSIYGYCNKFPKLDILECDNHYEVYAINKNTDVQEEYCVSSAELNGLTSQPELTQRISMNDSRRLVNLKYSFLNHVLEVQKDVLDISIRTTYPMKWVEDICYIDLSGGGYPHVYLMFYHETPLVIIDQISVLRRLVSKGGSFRVLNNLFPEYLMKRIDDY